MAIVSQGNSVVVDLGPTDAIWIKSTGNAAVLVNQTFAGTPDSFNVTTDVQRVGYYGEPVQVTIRAVTGQAEYQDQQFSIQPLTSTQMGGKADSSATDIALAVNGINSDVAMLELQVNGDSVMAFEPTNWGGWFAQTSYGDFIYGRKSSDPLRVYRSGIDLSESVCGNGITADGPSPQRIAYVVKAIDNETIICAVEDADGRYRLYKTSDGCNSWSLVFTAELTQVRPISDRSICDATVNGRRVLFYAEYNVNPLATGVTPESKLVLWRSDNLGDTWSEVTRWNTAGVNNTRHMHCIKQFEPNGYLYVCFGDTDPQSAIVRWDGFTDWPINTSWPDLPISEGLKAFYGRQAARAVDLVESDGRIYYLNDTYSAKRGDASDNAMWSFLPDLTDFRVESSPMSLVQEHAGWLGCKDDDGRVFFISVPDDAVLTGSKFIGVVASNKTKTSWEMAGAFRSLNSAAIMLPMGFMFVNGVIVLSSTNGSGKGTDNTASFVVSSNIKCRVRFESSFIPDTMHPVYWVDSDVGSNANNGLKPSSPFKDFSYPIAADRVPFGSSIQLLSSFTTFADTSTIVWKSNAASNQGDLIEPVTIRGYGASKTHIQYSSSGAITTSVFSISGGNRMRACFSDLTVSTAKSLRLFDCSQTAGQDNLLKFTRCQIGDPTKIVNGLIRSHTLPIGIYSCVIQSNKDSYAFTSTASASEPLNITVDSSLMLSSLAHFQVTNASTNNTVKLYNSKLYNSSIASFNISGAGAFSAFSGWNNEISSTYPASGGYVGAVSGGGTFAQKLQNTEVRGAAGNATAFADNCKVGLYPYYSYKTLDYID